MIRARAAALAAVSLLVGSGAAPADPRAGELFVDRAAEAGIDFVHFNGMSGELYFVEMAGSGAALFDYDLDGDLDVFLVQGTMLGEGETIADATFEPAHPLPLVDRLYRNDLEVRPDGTRSLRFTDVTSESGIVSTGYGMGVAVGDYDNDGWPDLYVTTFGPTRMFRNDGDGTFSDVTDATGTDDPRWSVPAVFFDYDADGWLDLYVGNYVDYRIATHKTCSTVAGVPDYCGPRSYAPVPGRLFHNRGRGQGGVAFEDVTAREGIASEFGPALGATASDFDGDGRIDLYVANDGSANQLWLNRPGEDGRVRFVNEALLAGCAVNEAGQPEASMGVVAGDFTGDGSPDLFMTHLTRESNTLYVNDGSALFEDRSRESGLGPPSWEGTGFGIALVDYDNDGWIDLFVANGAVTLIQEQVRSGEVYALKQRNQLYHNLGAGRFEEVPAATAGEVFARMEVSRGVAMGDVDNDGDSDLLLANNAGPARLLLNQVGQDRPWLGLRLVGGEPPQDRLGARATLYRKGAPPLVREARTDGSYASAGDPRVLFGLGRPALGAAAGYEVEKVHVRWPSGRVEEWTGLPTLTYTTLREGTGEPVAP